MFQIYDQGQTRVHALIIDQVENDNKMWLLCDCISDVIMHNHSTNTGELLSIRLLSKCVTPLFNYEPNDGTYFPWLGLINLLFIYPSPSDSFSLQLSSYHNCIFQIPHHRRFHAVFTSNHKKRLKSDTSNYHCITLTSNNC